MSPSELNRRAILAGAATVAAAMPAVPVLASPVSSVTPSDDPIFAAIERHRSALAALEAALHRKGEFEDRFMSEGGELCDAPDDPFGEVHKVEDDHLSAELDFVSTVPTTVLGMAAMLRYARECGDRDGEMMFADEQVRATFAASIEDFICTLAGLPSPETAKILLEETEVRS